jgi:FixJ family two-component response regulator
LPSGKQKDIYTVLVVDDDPSMLRALRRLIRAAGFDVLTFDGPRALLASEIPTVGACLLLDVHLPEMNGIELYEALIGSGYKLPVIMITGQDDAETRRLLQHIEAVAVLSKPVEEALLLDAISSALGS